MAQDFYPLRKCIDRAGITFSNYSTEQPEHQKEARPYHIFSLTTGSDLIFSVSISALVPFPQLHCLVYIPVVNKARGEKNSQWGCWFESCLFPFCVVYPAFRAVCCLSCRILRISLLFFFFFTVSNGASGRKQAGAFTAINITNGLYKKTTNWRSGLYCKCKNMVLQRCGICYLAITSVYQLINLALI